MSIESGPNWSDGEDDGSQSLEKIDDGSNPSESELEARPRLTQNEKANLPIVEVTEEDERELFTKGGGKEYRMSDVLSFKGIEPDSGFFRLRWSDGSAIIVTSEREHYGGLEE